MPYGTEQLDFMICNASHAIMNGNKGSKTPVSEFIINPEKDVSIDNSNLGLFNVTSPNMNTYYPEVDGENVIPQEGDFIYPVFRLLSEVTVNKTFSPVDFSEATVLKDSMSLLKGQTVYTEHEQLVGNHIGTIKEPFWQEAYTINGVKVPAGINAVLMVDAKSNPKIARGMLQDPPAIHSVSVSVMYKWKKSHDMENDEFYEKLGTFDNKGQMIRKIASNIILYSELSLVPHGADPYAQMVNKDGKITNPTWAKRFNALGEGSFAAVDYKNILKGDLEVEISNFNLYNRNSKSDNNKNKSNMDGILNAIAKIVGFTDPVNEENQSKLTSHIQKLISDNLENETGYSKEIKQLKADKAKLEADLQNAITESADLKNKEHFITIGESHLTDLRDRAVNVYTTLKGEDKDETIVEMIKNADEKVVKSLLRGYEQELDDHTPLTCQDCSSTNVTRASYKADDGDDSGEKPNTPTFKSNMEVIQNRRKTRFSVKRIHGEQ